MIGYIKGNVAQIFTDFCFIEASGVGYRIFISELTRQKLSAGSAAALFTYLNIREDAMLLYGFYTQEEYDLFMQLLSVNGVGPKLALSILSSVNPAGFRSAVGNKNMTILTKIPGIGKKTAERIILELKDKISWINDDKDDNYEITTMTKAADNDFDQASQTLQALGYNQSEFIPVLKKLQNRSESLETLIKMALKELSRL